MFRRKRKPRDFHAELDAHLALEADELRAEGLSDEDARFAAHRSLGNRTTVEERFFESGRSRAAQHLFRDLRFAVRIFGKDPKFSLLTILGLALGIGVSTALFSFVGFMVDRNTSGGRSADLVRESATYLSIDAGEGLFQRDFSYPEFRYLQDYSKSVEQMTAESQPSSLVFGFPSSGAEPEEVSTRFESSNFLAMRGFHAEIGRAFSEDEERAGAPVAVLSHAFWQRRFERDDTIIGRTILLNNHAVTIIGVADPRFHLTDLTGLFLPLGLKPLLPTDVQLIVNARLPRGVSLAQVQGEIETLLKSFDAANPPSPQESPRNRGARRVAVFLGTVAPSTQIQRREITTAFDLAISMILLIACSNLASLLLARASVRRRELGVRLSLGASRSRLVSQLLTESLLLAISGGLLGIFFSTWLAKLLAASVAAPPGALPPLDQSVLFYGLLLSLVTGAFFGLGPALAVTKTNLAQALHSEGMAGASTSRLRTGWSRRNLLVVVPLALSVMLLIGAAIMIQNIRSVGFINTSFDSSRVIALAFRLKDQGYDDAKAARFRQDLRDRVSVLPGVASAAIMDDSPFVPGSCQLQNLPPVAGSHAVCHRVSPEFFATVNLPILRGRPFTTADRAGSAPVAVVSKSFADKFFAGRQPLGERIQTASSSFEIVGVADDLYSGAGPLPSFPAVYIPTAQEAGSVVLAGRAFDRMEMLVRTKSGSASVSPELRQAVREADASLWVDVQTIDEYLARFTGNVHLAIFILAALGALVLLMASVGIYALLAYSVSQRTREIGIRIALGARHPEILMLVMRRTLILIAWGIAGGLLGALALGRILAAVVLNTRPPDTPTSIGVAFALAATSLLASYLPARKALRVNPVETLRCD